MIYIVDYVYITGEATTVEFDNLNDAVTFAKQYDGTVYSEDNSEKPVYPR